MQVVLAAHSKERRRASRAASSAQDLLAKRRGHALVGLEHQHPWIAVRHLFQPVVALGSVVIECAREQASTTWARGHHSCICTNKASYADLTPPSTGLHTSTTLT